jgi:metal-responsive CopG/Arc/MetJ family transcriptional regulator
MKTAVSIPDPVFEEADMLARQLGTSRSDIYARALRAFIGNYAPDRVTQAVDDVVDSVGTGADGFANEAALRVLGKMEW